MSPGWSGANLSARKTKFLQVFPSPFAKGGKLAARSAAGLAASRTFASACSVDRLQPEATQRKKV
jgi:hypothetical protein